METVLSSFIFLLLGIVASAGILFAEKSMLIYFDNCQAHQIILCAPTA